MARNVGGDALAEIARNSERSNSLNRSILRERLEIVVDATLAYLQRAGYQLPDDLLPVKAARSRDTREPLRKEKAILEEKIARLFRKQFGIMAGRVSAWAMGQPRAAQKVMIDVPNYLYEFDDEFKPSLIRLFVNAMLASGELWFSSVGIELDTSGFNARAYRAASRVVGDLIKDITGTTKDTVKDAIQQFITNPNLTVGDLANMLPFGEARANTIAVTETTRAFAQGEIEAGLELKEKYPDVPVVKIWFTNEDERVCPICGGLDTQEVPVSEPFTLDGVEYEAPPAHPNCRCWVDTRTRINND